MMDLKSLYDVIFDKYALELPLYLVEAPEDAVFPYVVVQLVNSKTSEFASGKAFTDDSLVQFNLFDKGPDCADLMIAYGILATTFDFAELEGALSCIRENTMQTYVDGVWQINVTYRIKERS